MNILKHVAVVLFTILATVNCASIWHAAPPTARHGPEPPRIVQPAQKAWIVVETDAELKKILYSQPRVVFMFGLQGCGACNKVTRWWNSHGFPAGWTFVEYMFDSDDASKETLAVLKHIELAKNPKYKGGGFILPAVAIIENAKPGTPLIDSMTAYFFPYRECTDNLAKWISDHDTHERGQAQ